MSTRAGVERSMAVCTRCGHQFEKHYSPGCMHLVPSCACAGFLSWDAPTGNDTPSDPTNQDTDHAG